MINKRGQVSTEYLVIIGVVLVIALVVVFLLTRTAGQAGGVTDTQSKNYWASASPFSITSYRASGTALDLVMKNNDVDQLTLTQVSGSGITTVAPGTVFANGQERTTALVLTATCGTTGTRYQYANVTFVYTKSTASGSTQTGLTQVGQLPLTGACA